MKPLAAACGKESGKPAPATAPDGIGFVKRDGARYFASWPR